MDANLNSFEWRDSHEAPISFLTAKHKNPAKILATVSRHNGSWEAEAFGRKLSGDPDRGRAKEIAEKAVLEVVG
jgi:hypothetical protein